MGNNSSEIRIVSINYYGVATYVDGSLVFQMAFKLVLSIFIRAHEDLDKGSDCESAGNTVPIMGKSIPVWFASQEESVSVIYVCFSRSV